MSARWKEYVVLLVDLQRAFFREGNQAAFPEFPANIQRLLATCRAEGIDLVHVRSRFRRDKSDWMPKFRQRQGIPCIEGSEGEEALPFAAEREGEYVLYKQTFDAFLLPDTPALLRETQKEFVLVAGLVTRICVFHSTVSSSTRRLLTPWMRRP